LNTQNKKSKALTTKEIVVFALLGTIMFCSKIILEFLPNIHLLGMLTMVYTLVFRKKALFPIYVYVFINGLYAGFATWWIPYLYIWTVLWAVTMLLPKNMPKKIAIVVYPLVCGLHGLLFGTLYAPAQALLFGLDFKGMISWIIAGLPWDAVHAAGNIVAGFLIIPLSELLRKLFKGQIADK
jgi:energy-coupling factor transport system substrate-specific component